MKKAGLEEGIRSLRQSLRQMKALLAWIQLKQSESRPGQPPSFTFNDLTETDLRNEYSFFLSTSLQIHTILNDCNASIPESVCKNIRSALARLEQQVYQLNLHQINWSF